MAVVFLSYSPEDVEHRDALERHIEPLRHAGVLRLWHNGCLVAGEDADAGTQRELEQAELILLLVSADYLASQACRDEMERALDRAKRGARVAPILLRPCLMGLERIERLALLPSNRRPVTAWSDRDSAWTEVATGIAALLGSEAPAPRQVSANRADDTHLRLLAELEDARVRRRRLREKSVATSEVDDEILALKRKLREGGHVRQGDILGGRYSLLQRIGRGGFATVWEAEDRELGRQVAVKILHANLADDPERKERFFRGARVMAELSHDAIARVLSPHEEDGGFCYFVMELVTGGDLQSAVLEARVSAERAIAIIVHIGAALTQAHERHFVHRDIKPANILLDVAGHPKLADFDLVGGKDTTGGTRTGAMGSFVYAAPEMLSHPQDADARADVFGLGMTALFCLYGKKLPDIAFRKPERVLEGLGRPEVAQVIAKAVEWEASDRYESVAAFCQALSAAEACERAKAASAPGKTVPDSPATDALQVKGGALMSPRGPTVRGVPLPEALTVNEAGRGSDAGSPSGREASASVTTSRIKRTMPMAYISVPAKLETSGPVTPPAPLDHARPQVKWSLLTGAIGASLIAALAISYGVARGLGGSPGDAPADIDAVVPSTGTSAKPPAAGSEPPSATASSPPVAPGSPSSALSAPLAGECPPSMVAIRPNGPVWIGSKDGEGSDSEHPRHKIELGPYCIDRTEVTVAAYAMCVSSNKCKAPISSGENCNGNKPERQSHPINCVHWFEARIYCAWAGWRLPTEEEWEFAARGEDERIYPWGSAPPSDQLCWIGRAINRGDKRRPSTCNVGDYPKGNSPFGLSDMAGNVFEWTSSTYCDYNKKSCVEVSRVIRGGAWSNFTAGEVRTAYRASVELSRRDDSIGFRCAKKLP